jgi:replicative DNA helicase Mcm
MQQKEKTLTDELTEFLRTYCREDVGELAQRYPKEQRSLWVSWRDLWQFDADVAEDYLDAPEKVNEYLHEALVQFDLPAEIDLSGATIRVDDLPAEHTYRPNELTTDHTGYVAVTGDLARVTAKDEIPTEAAFECQRCGTPTYIPQTPGEFQEPHECQGCERQGPFNIDSQQTEWDDYCRLRVKTPPEEAGSPNAEHIDAYAVGEPVHFGGEHGLIGRAGDRVTVYGVLERRQKDGRGEDGLFKRVLEVKAVEFPNEDSTVDVEAHRDRFEELAARDDAVDLLAESIAPALYATDAWETGMEWAVAYLFGAPRIELPDGTVYRGDIHGAIISDYGMGKSMFSHGVENLSPDCIRKSATALSSDVGLTAAAVKDDFGGGQWTLKPGVLVRGDGGHVILDEIDKGPDDLHRINDAIEGQQRIDVEKAGLSATYSSKVGLLVMGNPTDGRFDPNAPVSEEIGVDSSLLSRFDGIITMRDVADQEIDSKIANQVVEGYAEANQLKYGDLDREDFEALDRPVAAEVAQAWVKHSRENIFPVFGKELIEDIREWYASEVRQLNHRHGDEGGEDMPVPVTARVVMWVIRFSTAFARCHLRERVTDSDVERAMALSKRLVAQNWDGEQFVPEGAKPQTQKERKSAIRTALESSDEPLTPAEVADRTGLGENKAEDELESLARCGEVYRPETGVYRLS